MSDQELPITIKFAGGAEYLFNNVKSISVKLPLLKKWRADVEGSSWTIKHFLRWLEENYVKERPEMFFQDGSVRPGILVLVNDVDWELVGQLDYEIQANDTLLFMSTLHGG